MRNREDIERFSSLEMDAAVATMPPPCSFPDAEHEKPDDSDTTPSQTLRIRPTSLSLLSTPFILFISLPEPLKPLGLLAAAFAARTILTHDASPEKKP